MKQAIVFLNMGAPRDPNEVKLFLTNMFNDPNIITVKSKLLRKTIATFITTTRSKEAKSNYEKLGGVSPLVANTADLISDVKNLYPNHEVVNIMRYTPDFAKDVITDLIAKGVDEVVLFPLYPHYSTTTVKSSLEDFYTEAKKQDFTPAIKEIKPYFQNLLYNKAVVQTIKNALDKDRAFDFHLIFSAHSLPQKIVDRGDSYQKEVIEHTDILQQMLYDEGLNFREFHLAYQSKLGPVKWLEPSLDQKLKEFKDKSVIIVPLSFSLDNSETDFELSIEYEEEAKEIGIKSYKVAKCPNNSKKMLEFIKRQIDVK